MCDNPDDFDTPAPDPHATRLTPAQMRAMNDAQRALEAHYVERATKALTDASAAVLAHFPEVASLVVTVTSHDYDTDAGARVSFDVKVSVALSMCTLDGDELGALARRLVVVEDAAREHAVILTGVEGMLRITRDGVERVAREGLEVSR